MRLHFTRTFLAILVIPGLLLTGCTGEQTDTIEPIVSSAASDNIEPTADSGDQVETEYNEPSPIHNQPSAERGSQEVDITGSTYAVATEQPSGWFEDQQPADIMLSGIDFNNAGDGLLFHHPGGVATDGQRLYLADRNNNRVLVWNELPTANVEPDFVLGQTTMVENNPGEELNEMSWPIAVATDGEKLLVADTNNDRILVWNSLPTESGAAADFALETQSVQGAGGGQDRPGAITWPWDVWTNGEKLIVASTQARQVLIWNQLPSENTPADIVLYATGDFGTPRSIASDGTSLAVGDHNGFNASPANFFWKEFPTQYDEPYDYYMTAPAKPVADAQVGPNGEAPDFINQGVQHGEVMWMKMDTQGRLHALAGQNYYRWDTFPDSYDVPADVHTGSFMAGDGSNLAITGDTVYMSLSNANKIAGFSQLAVNQAQPDIVIGSEELDVNTLDTNYFMTNPVPATDGEHLLVTSDFDRKLYIWNALPDESGAHPDAVLPLDDAPWDNALHDGRFIAAGKNWLAIWEELPVGDNVAAQPTISFKDTIGTVQMQEIQGVALDDQYTYVSDGRNDVIYVWEGLPEHGEEPVFTLQLDEPQRLSTDGEYLAVSSYNHKEAPVRVFRVKELSDTGQPEPVLGERYNLPQGAHVSNGSLFVGDTSFDRLLVWQDIENAIAGDPADVVLGDNNTDDRAAIGQDRLFMPAVAAFDGSYLWVGEFKFSGRLLRFTVQ